MPSDEDIDQWWKGRYRNEQLQLLDLAVTPGPTMIRRNFAGLFPAQWLQDAPPGTEDVAATGEAVPSMIARPTVAAWLFRRAQGQSTRAPGSTWPRTGRSPAPLKVTVTVSQPMHPVDGFPVFACGWLSEGSTSFAALGWPRTGPVGRGGDVRRIG